MVDIDRQRIAAVRALEALGFSYQGGRWLPTLRREISDAE
jgi:hypothetical protein